MCLKRFLSIGALLGVLLTLWTTSTFGQAADPTIEALHKNVISVFFENVKSGSIEAAYSELFGGEQLGTEKDRAELVKETKKIQDTYGAYRGFEPVYTRRVGNDLVFVKYLYKCEKFPVLWHITFYRSSASSEAGSDSGTWQVVSIRFDTDLDVLTLLTDAKRQ